MHLSMLISCQKLDRRDRFFSTHRRLIYLKILSILEHPLLISLHFSFDFSVFVSSFWFEELGFRFRVSDVRSEKSKN